MKREIKFRAWDGVDYLSSPFTLQDIQLKKIEFTSDAVIMQFTGLKDKNDVDIYEGDIVAVDKTVNVFGDERSTEIIQVEIEDGITNCSPEWIVANEQGSGCAESVYCEVHSIEVIGNIHQNKELLNS